MTTMTDEELLAKARVLFSKLGGMKSQDARLVRALIERAGLGSQPTKRAGDDKCPYCHNGYISTGVKDFTLTCKVCKGTGIRA
jgi:hypothetical protein